MYGRAMVQCIGNLICSCEAVKHVVWAAGPALASVSVANDHQTRAAARMVVFHCTKDDTERIREMCCPQLFEGLLLPGLLELSEDDDNATDWTRLLVRTVAVSDMIPKCFESLSLWGSQSNQQKEQQEQEQRHVREFTLKILLLQVMESVAGEDDDLEVPQTCKMIAEKLQQLGYLVKSLARDYDLSCTGY